jgi:hypothetical protein
MIGGYAPVRACGWKSPLCGNPRVDVPGALLPYFAFDRSGPGLRRDQRPDIPLLDPGRFRVALHPCTPIEDRTFGDPELRRVDLPDHRGLLPQFHRLRGLDVPLDGSPNDHPPGVGVPPDLPGLSDNHPVGLDIPFHDPVDADRSLHAHFPRDPRVVSYDRLQLS